MPLFRLVFFRQRSSSIDGMFQGEQATRLRELVQSGGKKILDNLFIDLNPENRRDRIEFDETTYKGRLCGLPCVTESYKRLDRKTIDKITDIARVNLLFCFVLDR